MTFYRFWRWQSGCDIASVVLRDLDQVCQGQQFQMSISRWRWELAKIVSVWSLYLSSNWTISNVLLWHFPTFLGQTFQLLFGQVNARKVQTLLLPSDRKSGIYNLMAPLWMRHNDLDLHLKVTKFEKLIFRKRWKVTKHAQVWLVYKLIFAIEWYHWESYTLLPWHSGILN